MKPKKPNPTLLNFRDIFWITKLKQEVSHIECSQLDCLF